MTENDEHINKKVKVSDEVEEGEEDEFELEEENEHVESLYLETIRRKNLDFDFEKLCSVSLSNSNVYACLTCGKYFQGRGKSSHAYLHSVDIDHHVYINLQTLRIYVLPEGYEVKSASLDDIKYVVDPKYTKDQILSLDTSPKESYDLLRKPYWPGYLGINNIKENDYANVILQILAHVTPLRDFLLIGNIKKYPESINRLSLLVRKIWNPRVFKAHVSPHELLQHIAVVSQKKFTPIVQQDPFNFLNWFLNYLHLELGGSRTKSKSSLIQQVFQGKLQVESQRITSSAVPGDRLRFEADTKVEKSIIPFMFLSLDLPPTPLFQDAVNGSAIPQVLLSSLLAKYDGSTTQELVGHRKRYKIIELPQYLIFRVQRFNKNSLVDERNPTIITFATRGLDMEPYTQKNESVIYDLIANVTHEMNTTIEEEKKSTKHAWRIQILDKSRDRWLQIQDLVVEEVRRELLFLSESYIQVWERRRE